MTRTRPESAPALRIEVEKEWAWCGARRLTLTPRAFALLQYLVEHRERLITKDELFATVWRHAVVSDAALSSCIRDVRKALGDSTDAPRYVQTVHRRGFRFIGQVEGPVLSAKAVDSPKGKEGVEAIVPGLDLPDRPSIAVLPFQNMSGDPDQEYFADGLTEDIITGLSHQRWFFVIARNSSFTFRGKAIDIRLVSRELGARYLLEGSVRRAGNRIRVSAQLIDAPRGAHV